MAIIPHRSNQQRWVLIISSIVLGAVLGITVFMTFFNVSKNRGALIVQEVAQLADIFKKIHQTAVIKSFDNHPRSPINFLNVKSFAGSEVGPLNLAYPDKWEGPYLKDNPTIQTKEYELIRTKNGFYIVPGDGVTLPNGKVVGKDIRFDDNTDFASLLQKDGDLSFEGRPMAALIDLIAGSSTELVVDSGD